MAPDVIFKAKCTKFNFGWASASDPARGPDNAPPDLVAGFKWLTCKGREGKGKGAEGRGSHRLHF